MKHALVTGAGRGIGAAIARSLAAAGYSVALASRSRAELDAVAKSLGALGARTAVIASDLSKPEDCARLASEATAALGGIDTLINAAGVAIAQPIHKADLDTFVSQMTVNARAPYLLMSALVPAMRERRFGRVINIASVAGLRGYAYTAAYTMSKHAVVGLTRAAAAELASYGVTVNAVCPGYVDTPLTANSIAKIMQATGRSEQEARAELEKHNPQGRLIQPTEVAATVMYLLSDAASGVNGQAISLCGGELV